VKTEFWNDNAIRFVEVNNEWWAVADVRERYGVSPAWLTDNILAAPRFQRELDGIAANFAGRMGWRFEPTRFGEFMSKHFADIAKEAAR